MTGVQTCALPIYLFQRPSHAHLGGGGALRDPVPIRQPRRGRQLPIRRMHASAFDLDQTSGLLRLDHPRGALELVQPDAELFVGQGRQAVQAELVHHRSQRAHDIVPFERMFEPYTARLTRSEAREGELPIPPK